MVSINYPSYPSAPDLSGFERGLASLSDGLEERKARKALEAYADTLYGGQGGGQEMSLASLQPREQQVARAPLPAVQDPASARVAQAHAASGGAPPAGAIEAYIRHAAQKRGIDPEVAVKVAMSEGGVSDPTRQSDIVKDGVREQSYGPFQLYMNGGLGNEAMAAGIDPRKDWQAGIDFALDKAKEGGWGPWYGAAKAGIGDRDGIGGPQASMTGSGASQGVQMAQSQPQATQGGSLLPPREVMRSLLQNPKTREFGVAIAREAQKAQRGDPEAALRMEKLRLEVQKERTQAPGLVELFDEKTGQPYKARYDPQTGEYERVGGIKAPNGSELSIGPNGEVTFRQGSGLGKVTEAQSKDINYFQRGRAALPTIEEFETALSSAEENVKGSVPYIGNFMVSPDYQRGLQAGREFLAAILRKDTGAAVTKAEFDLYGPMFLPTPGDGPEVLGQKKVARQRAMEAIQTGLGGMGESLPEPMANPKGSGLPSGVTEEDVEFTMKKHGMSREQVLEKLSAP